MGQKNVFFSKTRKGLTGKMMLQNTRLLFSSSFFLVKMGQKNVFFIKQKRFNREDVTEYTTP